MGLIMKVIYKIKINNWEKYNKGVKPWHKKIMISTRFLDDPKISILSSGGKLLYLSLLLSCGDVASNSIECSHEALVKYAGGRGQDVMKLLSQLQEIQLVSFEKSKPLYNIKDKDKIKIKESKDSKDKIKITTPAESSPPDDPFVLAKKSTWESYSKAYEKRWGLVPKRNAAINKQIENFVKRLGNEDAPRVIEFYCQHKDSFYVKKAHPMGLALKDAESLYTQWKKGIQITESKMRDYNRKSEQQDLMDSIQQKYEAEKQQEIL